MKKTVLFIALLGCISLFAQTQPTVHNPTFDKIPKSSGSDCACSGWINKDVADQGESSTKNGSDVVKFDNVESDGIYQEIAVEANSDYTLDLVYWYSEEATTTDHFEVIILKGSGYASGYTPAYDVPADAAQDGFGYDNLTSVDDINNHVARTLIAPPGNTGENPMTQLAFNTGSETSIAIFIRAVGPYDAGSHGDPTKDKGWMNGDAEVRLDNLSLVNLGPTASVNDVFASKVSIYPNPANEFVTISSSVEINKIEVYNLLGKKVSSSSSLINNTLDISNLSKGMYLLKLTSEEGTATKKIVKL